MNRKMKLNRLKTGIFTVLAFFILSLNAQDNRPLVTIDGEDITVDDFMYVYKKNNVQGEVVDKKSISEYLDLFINFKLKVKEAEETGLDTVKALNDELAGYRKQLAEPYFVDETIIDELLAEAYERKKVDLRVSHILIRVGPNAMPADTMAAYEKAINAMDRIQKGESFAVVAADVSEDPSARERQNPRGGKPIPGNGGDLGYFTVFDMVYPFETGAYNTVLGDVSTPVRSDFGYHVIKVTDRIPAQGSMEVAHLFLKIPENSTPADSANIKSRIDSLYQRIQNGEDFKDLVKEYSDDKGSAAKGGLLPKFEVNRMVPQFIQSISQLSDSGDISKPVLTSYGWHIIQLRNKTGVPTFEEVKGELEKRLKKDNRSQKSTEVIVSDIKKEYGFKEHVDALQTVYSIIDSAIYKGKWRVPEGEVLNDAVCTIGDKFYSQKDLAEYIQGHQSIGSNENFNEYVNKMFKEFSDEKCKEYEDANLERKYPEFKAIMKEYHDGILLFELTNQKIWSYAGQDTVGLHKYYDEHKNEFKWDTRLDATLFTIKDTNYVDQVRALATDGLSSDDILKQINNDSVTVVFVENKKYSKEDNDIIDSIKWKKGMSENFKKKGNTVFVVVHKKLAPQNKTFDEARGLITAGFQEYLEKEWIKDLREKYPVTVHEEVLSTLAE
jgi:peptidyl-prolyl cis-trans isomerase SurA